MHPRFKEAVRKLYPNADFSRDVRIEDALDGKGPRLAAWLLPGSPPSDADIDAMVPQLDADAASAETKRRLAATDAGMARVAEDVAVAFITGQPIPQAVKDKINARRALRGETPI